MPDRYDKHDPIADLMAACHAGLCPRIRYAQSVLEEPSTRVIVPTKLIETPDGLIVRALQIEPEKGIRAFQLEKIVDVEPSDTPLGEHEALVAPFLGGEFYESTPRLSERPPSVRSQPAGQAPPVAPADHASGRTSPTAPGTHGTPPRAAWSQEWFAGYLCDLRDALVDAHLSDEEVKRLLALQDKLKLSFDQICAVHIYLMSQEMLAVSIDGLATDLERTYLSDLESSLSRLGWPIRM